MGAAGLFAALGGGAFVLASLVLGARLMGLSRRTGGMPERVMGLGLFLMGGVGYPVTLTALQGEGLPEGVRGALAVTGMLCNTVGMTAMAFFNRRVFRPDETWAALLLAGVALGYLVPLALQLFGPGVGSFVTTQEGPWQWTRGMAIVPTFWGGLESLRYHRMLRKRLELGMAEPVVVDRFRLWWIAMWTAAAISCVSTALELAGIAVARSPVGGILVGTLGMVVAASLWLAFFPPQAYLRRVAARSA